MHRRSPPEAEPGYPAKEHLQQLNRHAPEIKSRGKKVFWHRHFDITLLLAVIAMMSLQTPVRPPELYQTSERSLAAVVEPHTPSVEIIEVPRMFVAPPTLSIESRLLQVAPLAASVALGASESEQASNHFDNLSMWGTVADSQSETRPEVAKRPAQPQEIATPLYAM